jgi:hypothetical protein
MPGVVRRFGSGLGALWAALALVASYTAVPWTVGRLLRWIDLGIWRWFPDEPTRNALDSLFVTVERVVVPTYWLAVAAATFLVPLGLLVRQFARRRIRSGDRDILERPRAWAKRRSAVALAMVAAPAAAWTTALDYALHRFPVHDGGSTPPVVGVAFLVLVAFAGVTALGRVGLRALLAPTLDPADVAAPPALERDEIVFSAMAVTQETRAAVALSAASAIAAVCTVVALPALGVALALFPAALAAAYYRASRIAVGIDGVLVRGTSRTRFFAYRDFDEVRIRFGDVVLVRAGRTVVRLQLHGEDAIRRDAIVTRIRGALARVAERRAHATEEFVESATPAQIARAVSGAVDFRLPPLSREALWEIVEGSTVDADARAAAAAALSRAFDAPDRARLRVAAAQCAEPRLRIALEALDEDRDDADDAATTQRPLPARELPSA